MAPHIFFDGDLQTGISLAIQQQKLVTVFVRQDDCEPDDTWENEWLFKPVSTTTELTLGETVSGKSVFLRITHGSQEAMFLSAFCPITTSPTLVVIRNGQVLEKLEGGIKKEEFIGRLQKAVGLESQLGEGGIIGSGQDQSEDVGVASAERVDKGKGKQVEDNCSEEAQVAVDPIGNPSQPQAQESENERIQREQAYMKSLMAERAKRHAEEKARRDDAEEQYRKERAQARKAESEKASSRRTTNAQEEGSSNKVKDAKHDARARQDWIRQQKQRKDEAKSERQRILQQIENDKRERKRIQAERSESSLADAAAGFGGSSELPASHLASRARATGPAGTCALQIRLFDGSSVKGKFGSNTTLGTGVRTWINEVAGPDALTSEGSKGQTPFAFRQILAPQPSRGIEISEEGMSLAELGLTPTATLVLVPIRNAQEAYSFTPTGIVSGTASGIYGMVAGVLGMAGSALSYATGYGAAAAPDGPYMGGTQDSQGPGNAEGARVAGSGKTGSETNNGNAKFRIKTLADQRAADDAKKQQTEFYNGNSLGFESRKDDEEKD